MTFKLIEQREGFEFGRVDVVLTGGAHEACAAVVLHDEDAELGAVELGFAEGVPVGALRRAAA